MSQSVAAAPAGRRGDLPPELAALLGPSLQTGLSAGAAGLFVGAAAGIVRSSTPVLFSLITGAQWFVLGSTFTASRTALLQSWGEADKTKASALAGASAGLLGGLLRGPRNVLPAVAVFAVLGAGGQAIANKMPTPDGATAAKEPGWLSGRWSPVKPLSDAEYAAFIQEKILKLDVELAMVDEQIAAVRAKRASELTASTAKDT